MAKQMTVEEAVAFLAKNNMQAVPVQKIPMGVSGVTQVKAPKVTPAMIEFAKKSIKYNAFLETQEAIAKGKLAKGESYKGCSIHKLNSDLMAEYEWTKEQCRSVVDHLKAEEEISMIGGPYTDKYGKTRKWCTVFINGDLQSSPKTSSADKLAAIKAFKF